MSQKIKDIRELSVKEMEKRLVELKDELLNLNLRRHTGQVKNTAEFPNLRHSIARLRTLIGERQRLETASTPQS